MKGVLSFTDEELVSSDFIHNVQLGPRIGRMTYSNAPGGNVVYHYFSRIFTLASFWASLQCEPSHSLSTRDCLLKLSH